MNSDTPFRKGPAEERPDRPAGSPAGGRQEDLSFQKPQVLVTGGTGFVGSHLVEKLVRRGYRVRLLIRRSSSLRWLEGVPVEYAYGDVRDKASLAGACIGVRSVFHVGGVTKAQNADGFLQANAQGTRNLAEAMAERGLPGGFFIYVSSQAAAGPAVPVERDPNPVRTESDPPTPVTPYGRSKLEGEIGLREVADAHGRFRHVILRPPAVYGPRDSDFLVLLRLIKQGFLPVPRAQVTRICLIYVEDLVDSIIRAAETSARGTYYVTDGSVYTFTEVGRLLAGMMEVDVRVLGVPYPLAMLAATGAELWAALGGHAAVLNRGKVRDIWQPHWVCSSEKARHDWGFAPRFNLAKGFEDTLTWYRLNQML